MGIRWLGLGLGLGLCKFIGYTFKKLRFRILFVNNIKGIGLQNCQISKYYKLFKQLNIMQTMHTKKFYGRRLPVIFQ